MIEARIEPIFAAWRERARELLARGAAPAEVLWKDGEESQSDLSLDLFGQPSGPVAGDVKIPDAEGLAGAAAPRVSPAFVKEAEYVASHRDGDRWALLYRVLWRLTHGEPHLLEDAVDPDTRRFESMYRSVHRDLHKMKAFVRFREVREDSGEEGAERIRYVAWHEPDHRIIGMAAPFFRRRFAAMRWSILTPDGCAHWDGAELELTPGCPRSMAPAADDAEALWKTYYASIFNPARIKTRAMRKEMPVRYWKNLPESALISELIQAAPARLQEFHRQQAAQPRAQDWIARAGAPAGGCEGARPGLADARAGAVSGAKGLATGDLVANSRSLDSLRVAARDCRACTACEKATQTVFGEGPSDARIVLIGEQPGDQEDRIGRPFQGPAGQLLDRALAEAGLDRSALYLTNAVKHFKWKPQGKVRLHQKPTSTEISACRPWLDAELDLLKPELIVCLGASAAQAVLGKAVTIRDARTRTFEGRGGARIRVTTHPSAILRVLGGEEEQAREFARMVQDLKDAAALTG